MTFGVLNANPHPGQVQKLPNFGNTLASSLGQGLGEGVNKGISDAMKNSALQRALGMVNSEMSPLEQYVALSDSDPEARGQVMGFFGEQGKHANELNIIKYKHDLENAPNQKLVPLSQETLNKQFQLVKKGNLGNSITTGGVFNRERQRDIGQFTTNNAVFEQALVKKINPTGQLSNERFKYIVNGILPNADLSDKENYGRLEALADLLGLDKSQLISGEGFQGVSKEDIANASYEGRKRIPKGTVIRNPKTGATKIWNGTNWQDYKG